jgi:methyltransferase-like protein 6
MTEKARGLIEEAESAKNAQVTEIVYAKYEKDAKRNWDLFYKTNKTNFYKDRHYIKYEF